MFPVLCGALLRRPTGPITAVHFKQKKPAKSHNKMHFATDTKMPLQVTSTIIKETRKVYKKYVNQTSFITGSEGTELRDLGNTSSGGMCII